MTNRNEIHFDQFRHTPAHRNERLRQHGEENRTPSETGRMGTIGEGRQRIFTRSTSKNNTIGRDGIGKNESRELDLLNIHQYPATIVEDYSSSLLLLPRKMTFELPTTTPVLRTHRKQQLSRRSLATASTTKPSTGNKNKCVLFSPTIASCTSRPMMGRLIDSGAKRRCTETNKFEGVRNNSNNSRNIQHRQSCYTNSSRMGQRERQKYHGDGANTRELLNAEEQLQQEKLHDERMRLKEKVTDQSATILAQVVMISNRDATIAAQAKIISIRDATIAVQAKTISNLEHNNINSNNTDSIIVDTDTNSCNNPSNEKFEIGKNDTVKPQRENNPIDITTVVNAATNRSLLSSSTTERSGKDIQFYHPAYDTGHANFATNTKQHETGSSRCHWFCNM